jgi:hypothetical protein
VADRHVSGERCEDFFGEDLGDESHVFVHSNSFTITDGDTARLLASVLQGEKSEECDPGGVVSGGMYGKDAALFFKPVGIWVQDSEP